MEYNNRFKTSRFFELSHGYNFENLCTLSLGYLIGFFNSKIYKKNKLAYYVCKYSLYRVDPHINDAFVRGYIIGRMTCFFI